MSQAICNSLDGIRRREAKVSEIGGKDGLRPLPTLYTAIAEINRFRFKRNMPGYMVLSPEPFKSRYYTPLWGNRRFKAAREADRE